jgi:hypothetical protein
MAVSRVTVKGASAPSGANGQFKVQSGPRAGTQEEQNHITICDPVKGETISLDTLHNTAIIYKRTVLDAPPKTHFSPAWMPNFCAAQLRARVGLPGTETQDLGHRTVEGLDAVGALQKHALQVASNTGENSRFNPRSSVTETWCSEDWAR